ncbi:hypothetical protein [Cupriavidus necator]|uniref:hypothetical protein n=1 Tax=Cupriavidus necator TaxID=106590 RepID=UPI0005B5438F|nr:hypothetical protein [Cupriavidus necator]
MSAILEALFAKHVDNPDHIVTALNHQQIVVALSALVAEQQVAVLHMLYPRTDARTHRSLDALVSALHGHGLHEVAELIAQETHYLAFRDPFKAWKALQEIRHDSLAIGVHLFYKGATGDEAERALDKDAHRKGEGRYRVSRK